MKWNKYSKLDEVSPKFFSFFFNKRIWLAHLSNKTKLPKHSKIESYTLKYMVPALWPNKYIGERRTTFAKAYGIKVRYYGEHVGEHIGNQGKMKKKKSFPPKIKLKGKKSKAPGLHAWTFPLAAWNFSPQKSSSSFLAWANNNTSGKEHLREKVCLFSKDVKLVLVYLGAINRVLILHLQAQNSHVNQSDIIVVQRLVFHKTNNHLRKLSYVTKQARADFNSLCCLWWDSTPSNG